MRVRLVKPFTRVDDERCVFAPIGTSALVLDLVTEVGTDALALDAEFLAFVSEDGRGALRQWRGFLEPDAVRMERF
jgi:hypothetical protein